MLTETTSQKKLECTRFAQNEIMMPQILKGYKYNIYFIKEQLE